MSEDESAPKKPKLTHEEVPDSKQVPVASTSRDELQAKIFKLDIDCFDEIFEYLSLKDLHSFGETCKTMQQVAGEYFKRNYSDIRTLVEVGGIISANDGTRRISLSNFNQFITCIENRSDDLKPFDSIWSRGEFDSLRSIYFSALDFNKRKVKDFRNVWPKVETIELCGCDIKDDLYKICLKHCDSLKRLFLRFNRLHEPNANIQVPLFQREYPTLEHLAVSHLSINQLNMLLQNSPNLKRLTVFASFFWHYHHEFVRLKLEILELTCCKAVQPIGEMIMVLNNLHEQGFYKRLYLIRVDERSSSSLASLSALQRVFFNFNFNFNTNMNLSPLINLRELAIFNGAFVADMEILAKCSVNLERLYIALATIDDILPFVRQTKTLTKIKVQPKNEASFNGGFLMLHAMNKEREKLFEARKITIYVSDNIFLKTKWTTKNGDTNLSLIEMKRSNSYEWKRWF